MSDQEFYEEDDDSIPGGSPEVEQTWEEPDEYTQGFDEGAATVGIDAYNAGVGRDLIQGAWQLQEEQAQAEALDQYERQLAAAERDLGRSLSPGEWKHLEQRAYDPDFPADVGEEIRAYQQLPKAERMQRSIEAMWGSPETEDVLPGPADDNYGLGDNPDRNALREARNAWSLQRARLASGELEFDEEQ